PPAVSENREVQSVLPRSQVRSLPGPLQKVLLIAGWRFGRRNDRCRGSGKGCDAALGLAPAASATEELRAEADAVRLRRNAERRVGGGRRPGRARKAAVGLLLLEADGFDTAWSEACESDVRPERHRPFGADEGDGVDANLAVHEAVDAAVVGVDARVREGE